MSRWRGRPTGFLDKIEQDLADRQKEIASFALGRIVTLSPVDTGMYRQSHVVTLDFKDHLSMQMSESEGRAVIGSIRRPYGTVIIQSNLPYGEALEHGHSQQAPAGVYGRAALATKVRYG